MGDTSKVKVRIAGTEYALLTDDKESYIREVADEVSQKMENMLAVNPRYSITMTAVLTALEYCDEYKKACENSVNLRGQIKDYLEDSANARIELDNARREIERLNKLLKESRQP